MRGFPEVLRGCIALLILAVPSGASAAEWFLDLYGGIGRTHGTQIEAIDFSIVPTQGGTVDADFGNSSTLGIRTGFWIGEVDALGFAGDVGTIHAEGDSTVIDVVVASAFMLYRWRLLRTQVRPEGNVQPYIGGGVSWVYVDVDVEVGSPFGTVGDSSLETGWDLLGGVNWGITRRNGMFFEYRYSHIGLDLEQTGFFSGNTIQRVKGDLDTSRLLIGWSIRLGRL